MTIRLRPLEVLFGARVTFVYDSGAKVTMRFRNCTVKWNPSTNKLQEIEWDTPIFSIRKPLFINVDHVTAVWQGRV